MQQSRRHGGPLVGLSPQTKHQPPKLEYETLEISGVFIKFAMSSPLAPPPHLKLSGDGSTVQSTKFWFSLCKMLS